MYRSSTALTIISTLVAVGSATPQSSVDVSSLPSCATDGALQAIQDTGCQLTDVACICSSQDFVQNVKTNAEKRCDGDDLQKALAFGESVCESAGVLISPTSPVSTTETFQTYSPSDTNVSFLTLAYITSTTSSFDEDNNTTATNNVIVPVSTDTTTLPPPHYSNTTTAASSHAPSKTGNKMTQTQTFTGDASATVVGGGGNAGFGHRGGRTGIVFSVGFGMVVSMLATSLL